MIGFALPCVVLLLGLGLAQRTERFSPDLALMSATFGGEPWLDHYFAVDGFVRANV